MDISSSLRIGDVERDAALARLQSHYAAGRLSTGEFEERMEKALAAHYQSELDPLFTDLPDDPQTRFFDETGPVGRAARPSALTPWQAPPATRPSHRGVTGAMLVAVGGLVWSAALIATLLGAPGEVWAAAIAVMVGCGIMSRSLRRGDRQELPAVGERPAALPGGPDDSVRPHAGREQYRTARQEARAVRRELRDTVREQYRTRRREYRRRRRGR